MRFRLALIISLVLVGVGAALYRAALTHTPDNPEADRFVYCHAADREIAVNVKTASRKATVSYGDRSFELHYRNTFFYGEDRYDGPDGMRLRIDPEIGLTGFPDIEPQTCLD